MTRKVIFTTGDYARIALYRLLVSGTSLYQRMLMAGGERILLDCFPKKQWIHIFDECEGGRLQVVENVATDSRA